MRSLLISSTDTEVGKTFCTAALAAYYQRHYPRHQLGMMKPIQCGPGDRETYSKLFQLPQSAEEWNPLYFDAPLAPPLAAAAQDQLIDLGKVWHHLQHLQQCCDLVLIEALGGLGTPVTWELTVADIAREWRLPTVLVVPVQLGAIGQAVANVALAKYSNVQIRGIILNCAQPRTATEIAQLAPADAIANLTRVPVLGCLPYLPNWQSTGELATAAQALAWDLLW
jgi:dethiobiotin synthetase